MSISKLLIPIMFAIFYWYSGTDLIHHWGQGRDGSGEKVKDKLKAIHPFCWEVVKFLTRRKTLMAIGVILYTVGLLPLWQAALCGLAFFLIHFLGWWENIWMSMVRSLLQSLPVLLVLWFKGTLTPFTGLGAVSLCLLAYTGVWFLRNLEPTVKWWPEWMKYIDPRWKIAGGLVDWWWVMMGVTGACIGASICL